MSANLTLFTVGKLKDKNLLSIEQEFLKRLEKNSLTIVELKAFGEDQDKECEESFKSMQIYFQGKTFQLILLSEFGKEFFSEDFAHWYSKLKNSDSRNIAILIGGASGFNQAIKKNAHEIISLSKLTFPHMFARIIFIEQLFRAQSILKNHPYHK